MDFFINNLAVLLILLAIAGTIGFFWACNTKKAVGYTSVVSGRFSGKTTNTGNIPKSMATRKMWPKETCPH